MFKRLLSVAVALLVASTPVYAQQLTNEGGKVKHPVTAALPNSISGEKGSMDATAIYSASAGRSWDPLVDGLPIAAGGTTTKATAVAPTLVEGSTTNQLSTDLSGGLRISGSISATSAMKSTAADPSYTEGVTTNPISSDLAGYQRSLAKQAGTWNITNVSGTVSLPTGAATAAKQPALGTAGTSSADVITVQGRAAMTPLLVDGSAVTQPVSGNLTNISGTISLPTGAATSANQTTTNTNLTTLATNQTNVTGTKAPGTAAANSLLVGGVYNSAGVTLTNGQQASLQFDAAGGLKVSGAGGGTQFAEDAVHASGDLGTQVLTVRADSVAAISSATGDYQPLTTDANGRLWVNCSTGCSGGTQFAEDAAAVSADVGTATLAVRDDTPAGKTSANGDYTTLVTDNLSRLWSNNVAAASAFADGWDITQGTKADAAWTTGSGSTIALLKTIAGAALDTTTPTPMKIDQTTPGTTNHVDAGLSAAATGGCTPYGLTSAASTNSTNVKASAGTVCSMSLVNTTATVYYMRLYNASSAPTCSSATNFVMSIPIPASATGAGIVVQTGSFGWAFSTGISFCLTGGGSSTDNTNAATGVYVVASYK